MYLPPRSRNRAFQELSRFASLPIQALPLSSRRDLTEKGKKKSTHPPVYFSFALVFELYVMDPYNTCSFVSGLFFIPHYGFRIHPHCSNAAVHSFLLLCSVLVHGYAMIYLSISKIDKHLSCFHFSPVTSDLLQVHMLILSCRAQYVQVSLAYIPCNRVYMSSV